MRLTKPLTRETLIEIMHKGGCVICAVLKACQADLLEHVEPGAVSGICNYHGWALAAAAEGRNAALAFVRLLEKGQDLNGECGLCLRIAQQEKTTLRELETALEDTNVLGALERHDALCLRHADAIASRSPADLQSRILRLSEHHRQQLTQHLREFAEQRSHNVHTGGGILGRAAEFLFGYRGIPRPEKD